MKLSCLACHRAHEVDYRGYVCASCGANLEVLYAGPAGPFPAEEPRGKRTLWRYEALLPLRGPVPEGLLAVGWTPLHTWPALAKQLGLSSLYLKDDTRNPSASFKDRAGAVVLRHALERGERVICAASTGNAASSLACLAAGVGMTTVIFVPAAAPRAKIAQLVLFGARVVLVDGIYDDAFDLSLAASKRFGWYNRNTGYNPITREGKKTCAFEIAEQLGWKVPDLVFVPTGDGNILSGVGKGFRELAELGLIERSPRLVAVQAEGSAAITAAWKSGKPIAPVSGKTVADSISVSLPRDGLAALIAVRQSEGFCLTVADEEILEAVVRLAGTRGVFAEPAGAAAFAGLLKATREGLIEKGSSAALLVTGSGLKDIDAALGRIASPPKVAPQLAAFERLAATWPDLVPGAADPRSN